MKTVVKHLIPNTGTLIIVGLLFLVQSVGALPDAAPASTLAPSQTLISYQGTLTDSMGNPINGTVPMEFAFYDASTGGTLLWGPEHQNVEVSNGLFHVLLGSSMPIDSANLDGELWLDVTVNFEQLTPRERLTSVSHAVEASTLPDGAITRGDMEVGGLFAVQGTSGKLWFKSDADGGDFNIFHTEIESKELSIFGGGSSAKMDVEVLDGNLTLAAGNLRVNGYATITGTSGDLRLLAAPSGGDFNIYHTEPGVKELSIFGSGDDASMNVEIYDGKLTMRAGNIDMNGHTVVNCGALTEANLQTKKELSAGRIDRFEEGDVLCWSAKVQQLEKCATPSDPMIQAVADTGGRPIVIGAELVKVLGPVRAGDYLVASSVPGYAMAVTNPMFGTVIAQALEDFDGERGIIKAMIRKM